MVACVLLITALATISFHHMPLMASHNRLMAEYAKRGSTNSPLNRGQRSRHHLTLANHSGVLETPPGASWIGSEEEGYYVYSALYDNRTKGARATIVIGLAKEIQPFKLCMFWDGEGNLMGASDRNISRFHKHNGDELFIYVFVLKCFLDVNSTVPAYISLSASPSTGGKHLVPV